MAWCIHRFVAIAAVFLSGLVAPPLAFAEATLPQLEVSAFYSQIFWLIVSFSLLFAVINYAVIPRINAVLQNRMRRIDADLSAARKFRREVETSSAENQENLEKSRQEAQDYLNHKHQSQQAYYQKQLAAQMQKIATAISEGETNIAEKKRDALAELDSMAADLVEKCVLIAGGKKPAKSAMTKALKS